jgi:hypothetical protein
VPALYPQRLSNPIEEWEYVAMVPGAPTLAGRHPEGHGCAFIGIYTSAILGKTLPLPVVIGMGGLASFCLALLIGALTLRLRGIYFAIFTLRTRKWANVPGRGL